MGMERQVRGSSVTGSFFFLFIWYVVFFSSAAGNAEAWARADSSLRLETTKEERQLLPISSLGGHTYIS